MASVLCSLDNTLKKKQFPKHTEEMQTFDLQDVNIHLLQI